MRRPISNPITRHLRRQGTSLRYWAKINNVSEGMVNHVIHGRSRNQRIIHLLKDQGFFDMLPKRVQKFLGNGNDDMEQEKVNE